MKQISNDEFDRLMEDFEEDETPTHKPKRRKKYPKTAQQTEHLQRMRGFLRDSEGGGEFDWDEVKLTGGWSKR